MMMLSVAQFEVLVLLVSDFVGAFVVVAGLKWFPTSMGAAYLSFSFGSELEQALNLPGTTAFLARK